MVLPIWRALDAGEPSGTLSSQPSRQEPGARALRRRTLSAWGWPSNNTAWLDRLVRQLSLKLRNRWVC